MDSGLNFFKLVEAYKDCRRRKRNKATSLEFEINMESNLLELYSQLVNQTYEIGKSVCFVVLEPKPREIWAANFRDRIVHHLIYNAVSERFYNRFIKDTYSCIPKRGTLYASCTMENYVRAITDNYTCDAYYLKADIKNFFVSINRDILYGLLKEFIKEDWLLSLLYQVVYNDCRNESIIHSPQWKFDLIPDYKSLWNAAYNKGLPIGNLTSQFFSNVYLNVLDQYIKHHWHCKYYCRYVDDFIILDTDPKKLNVIHKDLTRFLKERLDLDLHQDKRCLNKVSRGIDFVGYKLRPNRIYLRQKIIKCIFKRIRDYKELPDWYTQEKISSYIRSINSYLGMLRNVNGYKLRKEICSMSINLFISCDEEYTKLWSNMY